MTKWGASRTHRTANDDRQRLRDYFVPHVGLNIRMNDFGESEAVLFVRSLADLVRAERISARTARHVRGVVRKGAHTKSSAYKSMARACDAVGVRFEGCHLNRHTMITWARRGGARADVLERVTHNATGAIIDQYTHFDWEPLCDSVLCLDYVGEGELSAGKASRSLALAQPAQRSGTIGTDAGAAIASDRAPNRAPKAASIHWGSDLP